ncbi:MAG TPA: histone H1 [Candidatus Limnocylindria bacterium]|nr:histone H1 [Candidatus Limnocylindria bacterium]
MKQRKMPRDPNQRAKLTLNMVLGEAEPEPAPAKDPERVERGKKGGAKGGKLRAERLSPERRREIAQKAAAARWRKG